MTEVDQVDENGVEIQRKIIKSEIEATAPLGRMDYGVAMFNISQDLTQPKELKLKQSDKDLLITTEESAGMQSKKSSSMQSALDD